MRKISFYVFLAAFFNFYASAQAFDFQAIDSPRNYIKGKFYNSVKNHFLVATEKMKDSRFKNTVIVMLGNDEKGAWGLVINKPLGSIPLSSLIHESEEVSSQKKKLYNTEIPIFWGGPVNKNAILILHSEEYKSESTRNYKNISVSSDYNTLFEIADKKGPKESLVILGISSWGSGQLEGEMQREDWALSDINADLIFEADNNKKWLDAISNSFIRL